MTTTTKKQKRAYSPTYPTDWTEDERKAAEAALTKEQRDQLLQELETPPDFWEVINSIFHFDIDVCANAENSKCPVYITAYKNGLLFPWFYGWQKSAWCNPGFSNVLPWHHKAYASVIGAPGSASVVAGIPGGSQEWYAFARANCSEIIHLTPRVHYLCPWPLRQQGNTRESCLYVYRHEIAALKTSGRCKDPAPTLHWRWK